MKRRKREREREREQQIRLDPREWEDAMDRLKPSERGDRKHDGDRQQ